MLWIAVLREHVSLPTAFTPLAWHAHEMIFGFAAAAVAGFMLTAIPNWTGRMPLQGLPLIILFTIWFLGRVVMAISALTGPGIAAVIDLSFLGALLAVVMREIVSGRNWRNLPMTVALAVLLVANALTHLGAAGMPSVGLAGQRLGIATLIILISLVGGRIIPSFTRNWLAKRAEPQMPASFGRIDGLCLVLTFAALGLWVASPESWIFGAAALAAALANVVRLVRWRGHRTLSQPLLWSLHLGFAWIPVGLGLLGVAVFWPTAIPASAGLHALTVGAIGSMTLAVMTRATLGHSARQLTADSWTLAIYILIAVAAISRVAAPIALGLYVPLLLTSGLLWSGAFILFTVHYGRMLLNP